MKGIYKEPEMEIVQFDEDMITDTVGGASGADEADSDLEKFSTLSNDGLD
jgi:hypothetical protein